GFAGGRELFGELLEVWGNGGVGQRKDFGGAAVVGLDLVDFCLGIAFGELENVLEMRAAPGVNALRVVADDHDVAMTSPKEIDEIALDAVGVLVFVDEYELKASLVLLGDIGMFSKELQPENKQVIEVHRVTGAFAGHVAMPQFRKGLFEAKE